MIQKNRIYDYFKENACEKQNRKVFKEEPSAFDPRKYLTPARELIKETVKQKIVNIFGSSDKI